MTTFRVLVSLLVLVVGLAVPPAAAAATTVPAIVALSTGDASSCAVTSAGTVFCWGRNEAGPSATRTVKVVAVLSAGQSADLDAFIVLK